MEESQERKFSSNEEKLIYFTSTALALSISEGKTASEIEYISLLLENIVFQLNVIADIRLLNDGEDAIIAPIL